MPTSLDIRAKVTLEPCAVVRVAKDSTVTVGGSVTPGRIVAHGGDGAVHIESASPTAAFGRILLLNGQLDFDAVTLLRGGEGGAAIDVRGPDDGTVAPLLHLRRTQTIDAPDIGTIPAGLFAGNRFDTIAVRTPWPDDAP